MSSRPPVWQRHLLLVGLSLAGLAALGAGLFPRPTRPVAPLPSAGEADDLRAAVAAVDAAFERQWGELGVRPAPPASDLAVARRLALALTGAVPSVQEVRQLEALPEGERLPAVLANLFHDRRYADYVAERLARACVGVEDGPFIVFRRRRFVSWLSDQLLQNRPYDDLVRGMIADTGLWTDKPATNFLTVTYDPERKVLNPERLAGRVARAFLGVRLDCAQCHNHPFEKWKQADFQGLAAFFGQAEQGFTGIYDGAGEFEVDNRKTGAREQIAPRVPFLPDLLPADGPRRERLARWVTDRHNPYFARATANRAWAILFGRPLAEPVDSISASDVPPALQVLADDFAAHGFDLQRLFAVIAASRPFRLDSAADYEVTDIHEKALAVFPLTRLRAEQVAGALLQAASLETLDRGSHILLRTFRYFGELDFIKRYGDAGEDEFDGRGGTIPQRLVLMNGGLVHDKTKQQLFNAATRIGWLAPDDRSAVETAYLAVLTRRPTPAEAEHFAGRLAGSTGGERSQRMEDLYWALLNSAEFAWNH